MDSKTFILAWTVKYSYSVVAETTLRCDFRIFNDLLVVCSSSSQFNAYSFMSRVMASPKSIVTVIVNSDAHHQSPLMDKWERMLYV